MFRKPVRRDAGDPRGAPDNEIPGEAFFRVAEPEADRSTRHACEKRAIAGYYRPSTSLLVMLPARGQALKKWRVAMWHNRLDAWAT